MGEVAERSEVGGGTHFSWKSGYFAYLLRKQADSPRPCGAPPLINAGGQDFEFFDSLRAAPLGSALFAACRRWLHLSAIFREKVLSFRRDSVIMNLYNQNSGDEFYER